MGHSILVKACGPRPLAGTWAAILLSTRGMQLSTLAQLGTASGATGWLGELLMIRAVWDGHRLFRNYREDEQKGCPLYEKAAQMQRMDKRLCESS